MALKFSTIPPKTLLESITAASTTFKVNNILGFDGAALTAAGVGDTMFATFQNSSGTIMEIVQITTSSIASTSITMTKRGLQFYEDGTFTEVTANKLAWTKGITIVNLGTDTPQLFQTLKTYIDGIAIAGAPNATTSLQGLVELSTTAEINAGTATGGTGAALTVTPDGLAASIYGTRLPTADQSLFLAGMTGMIVPYAGSSAPTGFLLCDGSAVSRTTYATLFALVSTTYGIGNGSTTFNLPNLKGRMMVGAGTAATKIATFASRASNVITVTGLTNAANNEFQTGQAVLYSAPSGAMTGLTDNTTYYIIRTGNLTFSLASSLANAQNGTVISLSSDGTGTQTFTLTLTARTLADTGGEENHAMSLTELLGHNHSASAPDSGSGATSITGIDNGSGSSNFGITISSTGGNAAMNNTSPFLALNFIIKY